MPIMYTNYDKNGFWNSEEMAEILSVSVGTIRNYCRDGIISATKEPFGIWLSSDADFAEYIEKYCSEEVLKTYRERRENKNAIGQIIKERNNQTK